MSTDIQIVLAFVALVVAFGLMTFALWWEIVLMPRRDRARRSRIQDRQRWEDRQLAAQIREIQNGHTERSA